MASPPQCSRYNINEPKPLKAAFFINIVGKNAEVVSSDTDLILRWLLKILPGGGGTGPILTVVLMKAVARLSCWMRSDPEVPDIPSDDPGQGKG